MAHQHHLGPGDVQIAPLLRLQHRRQVSQAITKCCGTIERLPPLEQTLNSGGIAAGMLKHHHGPARLHQRTRQPVEVVGVPAQPRHHQNPGPVRTRRLGNPTFQPQWPRTMAHRKRCVTGRISRGRTLPALKGLQPSLFPSQSPHQGLMTLQFQPPAVGSSHQRIQIQTQLRGGQRLQHIQR